MIKAQDGTKLPTAPKAEDRYANSIRLYADNPRFKYDIRYLDGQTTGVVLDTPYSTIPASITQQVVGNDTIYRETPDQKRFSLRGFPVTRTATNTDSNRQEFETMRRRFNTAWGVAKHEEGSKIKPSPATPYDRGLNKFNTNNSVPEVIVKGNRPYRFDRRVLDQGAGHKVASDILWNEYQDGKYAGDFSGIAGGRTIYYSPQGNDTVYMNPSPIGYFMDQPGLNWIDNGSGFMPVPTNRNNLTRNKKAFYGNIRKSHVGATDTWMRPIFQRAKRGN